jgi:dipeptidyl aminopeptidase/acylaminoacyl peptidase
VPAEGGRARRVARGTDPVWSPDGKRIAFGREVKVDVDRWGYDEATYVYAVTRRTGRARRVSSFPLEIPESRESTFGLDWQPLPPAP